MLAASILAGFAFTALVELDINEETSSRLEQADYGWMEDVYYVSIACTMAFRLYIIVIANVAVMNGQRMAVHGVRRRPGGLTLALDPAALTRARLATRMPGRRHGDDPVGAPRGARRRGRHDRGGACRPGPTRWRSLPRALPCTAATAATAGCVRTCRSFAPASVTRSHAQAPASADYPPPPGRQISAEELVDETKNDDVQQARAAGRM